MAAKISRHIALTAPLLKFVEAQVALGNYTSISDMVRVALRLLQERDNPPPRVPLVTTPT